MVIVGVGSENPVKIEATEKAFRKFFDGVIIKYKKVDSGINSQPLSDEEMVLGAINRAKKVFELFKADFGVGLEGGVIRQNFGVFVRGWVAIYDGQHLSIASTVSMPLPKFIWEELINNRSLELESIMERISGIREIGDKIGAFGFFTNGRYNRAKAFEDALVCALAPFIKPNLYWE